MTNHITEELKKKSGKEVFNLLVHHREGTYNILGIDAIQLAKIVKAYLNGDSNVTINGTKYLLNDMNSLKIYTFEYERPLKDSVDYSLRNIHYHKRNTFYGKFLPSSTLEMMGKDVTSQYLQDEAFGSKAEPPKAQKTKADQIIIFLSWQSDSKNERQLIDKSLKNATKKLESNGYSIKIESDMRNTSGSSDIPSTLFKKIETSDIFIADINLVYKSILRPEYYSPNPNVLLELGFAAAKLGWSRMILVMNKDEHKIEELPFDIRHRSVCWYRSSDIKSFEAKIHSFIETIIKEIIGD